MRAVETIYTRRIGIVVKIIGDVGIPLPVIGLGRFYIRVPLLQMAVRFWRIVVFYLCAV